MSQQLRIVGLTALVLIFLSTGILAQTGGGVDLTWNVMGNGGTTTSSGGSTSMSGTLGQFGSGPSSGGTVNLDGGFWQDRSSGPLSVTLGYFVAGSEGDTVHFAWQTATESGTAGFDLYAIIGGSEVRLNDIMIPSPVIDSVTPTAYHFSADVEATEFMLQEVKLDGSLIEHGPFSLGVEYGSCEIENGCQVTTSIWLPMVTR